MIYDKPVIHIRSEILQDKLYLLSEEALKHQSIEELETMVEYWNLWLEAVAGKQVENLLECRALAEKLIANKRGELREYQAYKHRRDEKLP
jgi:predicted RecB family endonuclease